MSVNPNMFGHGIGAGNGELAGALLGTGAFLNARRGNRRDMQRRHEMDMELARQGHEHSTSLANIQAGHALELERVRGAETRLTDAQRQGHERGMQDSLHAHQTTTQTSAQDHEIKKMRQEGTTYRSNLKAAGKVISGLGAGGAEGAVAPGAKSVNLGGHSVTFNAPTKPARKKAAPTTPAGGKKPSTGGSKPPAGGNKPAGGGTPKPAAPKAPKAPRAPKVK